MNSRESYAGPVVVLSPSAWRAAVMSVGFIVDVSRISRAGGGLLDPLLMTAVLEANQAALMGDPELQRLYGEAATALPDRLRRPISMNAIALSLRLPFETVRRRIRDLAARGLCQVNSAGVVVPAAVVTSPPYLAIQAARVERLMAFHAELAAAKVVSAEPILASPAGPGVRAADRALAQYMLRACDGLIALTGAALPGFLLLGLVAANTEHLSGREVAGLPANYAAFARPKGASELARDMGLAAETVRRNLFTLAGQGLAMREGRGWLAAAPSAAHARLGGLVEDNQIALRRLFARIADLAEAQGDRHSVGLA